VPHIRFHGLRHTHGTLMALSGINPKVIAERMGHSSVAFFLDTYGHVLPGMQPDAAEQLADLVLGPDGTEATTAEDDHEDDRDTVDEHPDEDGDAA
jgi:integrase